MLRRWAHQCIDGSEGWESYDEERTAAGRRSLPDRAVMKLHKFLHYGEPEPSASVPARHVVFNLDEALKNSFAHSNRNAWAIVLNLEDSVVSGGFQYAGDSSSIGTELESVGQKIDQHSLNHFGIHFGDQSIRDENRVVDASLPGDTFEKRARQPSDLCQIRACISRSQLARFQF